MSKIQSQINDLFVQFIVGLNESYEGLAMLIQQKTPLPDFYEFRSKLVMEESQKAYQYDASTVTNRNSATSLAVSTIATGSHSNSDDHTRLHQSDNFSKHQSIDHSRARR